MDRIWAWGLGLALLAASAADAETRWEVAPSLKYDALCLTGILADDPYQTQFYRPQRETLLARLSPATVAAGARVHQAFKAAGVPTVGFLGLAYSGSPARDLPGMIAATARPQELRAALEATPYWDAGRWRILEQVQPDLLAYLRGLEAGDFAAWWAAEAAPEVEAVLVPLRPRLGTIDFSAHIARTLGRPGPQVITVHATRLCRPFGARLLGDTFIMDVVGKRDPFRSVGAGAIHEMTHPPFDPADPRIVALVAQLRQDPVLSSRFAGRPTDSGYNTFEGYINEDVTRALDQLIGERVGVTFVDDADARWREQEGGFHMAAGVFYRLMRREGLLDGGETATAFLDRMRRQGELAPDRVKAIVEDIEAGPRAPPSR